GRVEQRRVADIEDVQLAEHAGAAVGQVGGGVDRIGGGDARGIGDRHRKATGGRGGGLQQETVVGGGRAADYEFHAIDDERIGRGAGAGHRHAGAGIGAGGLPVGAVKAKQQVLPVQRGGVPIAGAQRGAAGV